MAGLKSWDQIANDPKYQALPDSEKLKVQNRYTAAGGTTEEAGMLQQTGEGLQAGLASAWHGMQHGSAGVGRMVGNALGIEDTDKTFDEYEAQADSTYKENTKDLHTKGAEIGKDYGETVGDIALTLAAPELGIPLIAARQMGKAYEEQKPEERSAGKAIAVGGVNLAANTLLPGVGGRLLNKLAPKAVDALGIDKAATALVDRAFGEEGAKVASSLAHSAGRVASNTIVGATAGAGVGATEAYARGQDVGQGALEGAKSGAAFGGLTSGAMEAPKVGRALSKIEAPEFTKSVANNPKMSDEAKQQAIDEHASIVDAPTPEAKAKAYSDANVAREMRGNDILQERGVPVNNRIARGDEHAQKAFGVTEQQANADITRPNAKQDQVRADDLKSFKTEFNNQHKSISDSVKSFKAQLDDAQLGADIEPSVKRQTIGELNKFNDLNNQMYSQLKRGDFTLAKQTSIQLENTFNNLHPEVKAHINDNMSEVKGFGKDYSPVDFAHEVETYTKQQNRMNTEVAPDSPLFDAISDVGAFGITFGKIGKGIEGFQGIRARKAHEAQAKQYQTLSPEVANQPATQAQKLALAGHPNIDTLTRGEAQSILRERQQPAPKAEGETGAQRVSSEQIAKSTEIRSQRQQETLAAKRSQISDPEIAKEITVDNMHDKNFMKNIRKRDDIANIGKATEAAKLVEKSKQQRLNIAHKESLAELDRWHKEDAPYIDYNKYIKPAKEKAQKQTAEGARLSSATRVKTEALKQWAKDNHSTATGSKAEFLHTLNNMSVDIKAQAMPIIDNLYANGAKNISPEQLKSAWNKIHDLEANAHEAAGHKSLADAARKQAQAKSAFIDNSVLSNQADALSASMKKAVKEAHDKLPPEQQKMNESQIEDLVNHHIEQTFKNNGNKPFSKVNFDEVKNNLSELAKKEANAHASKTPLETEEGFSGETEEIKKAKETLNKTGKVSEESKANIEESVIHDAEKAFREGNIEEMKKHADTVINHFFRNDSKRIYSTKQYISVLEKAHGYKAKYPNNPELWLTSTDVRSIAAHGSGHASGRLGEVTDLITGKQYNPAKMLTDTQRKAKIEQLERKGKGKGALTGANK